MLVGSRVGYIRAKVVEVKRFIVIEFRVEGEGGRESLEVSSFGLFFVYFGYCYRLGRCRLRVWYFRCYRSFFR